MHKLCLFVCLIFFYFTYLPQFPLPPFCCFYYWQWSVLAVILQLLLEEKREWTGLLVSEMHRNGNLLSILKKGQLWVFPDSNYSQAPLINGLILFPQTFLLYSVFIGWAYITPYLPEVTNSSPWVFVQGVHKQWLMRNYIVEFKINLEVIYSHCVTRVSTLL